MPVVLLLLAGVGAPSSSSALFVGSIVDKAKNAAVDAAKDLAKEAGLAVVRQLWQAAREPAMKFFEKVKPKLLATKDLAGKQLVDSFLALIDEVDNLKELSMDVVRKLIARLNDIKEKLFVRAKELLGEGIEMASEAIGGALAAGVTGSKPAADKPSPEDPFALPRVPELPAGLKRGVLLDASIDVVSAYVAATKTERDGAPSEKLAAWQRLAAKEVENPYKADAAEREATWTGYLEKHAKIEADAKSQFEKLQKLVLLPVLEEEQKRGLVAQYGKRFKAMTDWTAKAGALLATAAPPPPPPVAPTAPPATAPSPVAAPSQPTPVSVVVASETTAQPVTGTDAVDTGAKCTSASTAFVEGGEFKPLDRDIARPTVVNSFCMEKTEVTVASHEQCVKAGSCRPAPKCGECSTAGSPELLGHPVNCVTFDDASRYCAWKGGRLPTEAEFEWVARGGRSASSWPWSKSPPSDQVCLDRWSAFGKSDCTCRAGALQGNASREGILDLIGNVKEWTESMSSGRRDAAIRGGSWRSVRAGRDYADAGRRETAAKDERSHEVGFRCVYSSR